MATTAMTLSPPKEDLLYKYPIYQYYNVFGTWSKFLKTIGEPRPLTARISKEEVREYFDRVLPKRPPFPKLSDIQLPKYGYGAHMISKYWGHYADFLLDIGRITKDSLASYGIGKGGRSSTVFWSHQDYIDQYNIVKRSIHDKIPSSDDIDRLYREGKIKMPAGSFTNRYMSLGRFQVIIGDKREDDFRPSIRHSDWDIDDVTRFYNILRKDDPDLIIRSSDMEEIFGALESRLRNKYKLGWFGFLKKYDKNPKIERTCPSCGKIFIRYVWDQSSRRSVGQIFASKYCSKPCKNKHHTTRVSKEELIDNYYNLKKHLHRIPLREDLNNRSITPTKYSWHPYSAYWDSWYDFLLEIKEIGFEVNKRYLCSKQDVLDNFNSVAKRIGRCPTRADLSDKDLSKYPPHTINFFWGSWAKFLEDQHIGEEPKKQYSYAELLRTIMNQQERIRILEREIAKK